MKLFIRQVLDIAGEQQDFSGALDLSWVKRYGQSLFPNALAASGQVSNRAGVVTLRYQISGKVPFVCDRCLMQFERELCEEFTHTVVERLEDETLDDVFLLAPQGVLMLDEVASTDLQLSLPQVILCREDCKGLCPVCGADLNKKDCGCRPQTGDPRLQVLKDLLKN